ncbi:DUF3899 domain-containing protein [Mammaliicoccus sp. Dog046]|uniref:DUF3899 domain-containing protein n=1 Tax=Mammaliicoccus sp. Dog046 TaxID=3034233 RepID=UPI002B260D7E|nr:DUF3899 domain-containing protein [Mammaliicoccus sp. Dog046]WQK84844.1 DUF3899 domain-containing protein [Mammaliicoccus sp. Dog046]
MKYWYIISLVYIVIFLLLSVVFMNHLDQASNIYFYIMTVLFAVSWFMAMRQDGVGDVSKQAIRKFNFHMKSKASQEYLKNDDMLNPNMKDIHIKERKRINWLLPFVVLSTIFFIISILLGFVV